MKVCSKCKLLLPFENFHLNRSRSDGRAHECKTCRVEGWKKHYAEHSAQILEKERAWRTKNHTHYRARRRIEHKRYYAKYREKILQRHAAYADTHREAINQRNYRWLKRHPERIQIHNATRRARVKNAPVIESINLEILAIRDHWICHICKRKVTRRTWSHDHLIPLSKGGDHTYLNVALCHQRCNSQRGTGRLPAQLRLLP
jgi:5-methylcytosine-specific restriction endonuclease McrA